ncbi:MAG: PepSY-associated TM helix domain-containing protein [Cellvibrio sp.]
MKNGFRQSMAWVHTWGGLSVGWILFFVFLTGTAGYFDTEIDRWMKPELPVDQASVTEAVLIAQKRLEEKASTADRWLINPPINRDTPNLRIFWQNPPTEKGGRGKNENEILNSTTGEQVTARSTGGGQTLYRMHYALHYLPNDIAYWIVGFCSMFMFVAIITGIIIHKKIFKDFFTFRPRKGQRSWLDMHNVLSVTSLPFHIMITYSGLLFFAFTYMPLIVSSSYGTGEENQRAFFDELFEEEKKIERTNSPASLASLTALVAIAEERWGKQQVRYLEVTNPGDETARVTLGREFSSPLRNTSELIFNGVTGELIREKNPATSMPLTIRDTFLGLHEGLFADTVLRWLYFLSGLLGTAMIATGMILWTVKRRPQQLKQATGPDFGHRLVESLNLGTIVGLPIAIAAYFWANRLLPIDFAARKDWEINSLFIVWLIALVYPLVRPIMRAWTEQLWFAATAFCLLPVLNAFTTDRHLLKSIANNDWVFAGFDLTMLAAGILFGYAAIKLQKPKPVAQREPKHKTAQQASANPPLLSGEVAQ